MFASFTLRGLRKPLGKIGIMLASDSFFPELLKLFV